VNKTIDTDMMLHHIRVYCCYETRQYLL